jgi:hypothetical protein
MLQVGTQGDPSNRATNVLLSHPITIAWGHAVPSSDLLGSESGVNSKSHFADELQWLKLPSFNCSVFMRNVLTYKAGVLPRKNWQQQ